MNDKEKQIEEIYNLLFCDKWEQPFTECPEDIRCIDCIARKLYEQGYRKIPQDSVILTREELSKRDYEFRQIGYDECLRDNPKKDKYIKTLERKIDQLNAKLDQSIKETAKNILEDLDNNGVYSKDYTNFMRKQFGVEIEE